MNPGVEAVVTLELVFQDKVTVMLFCTEEGIGRLGNGCTDNDTIFNSVLGNPTLLGPTIDGFTVKKVDPLIGVKGGGCD